MAIYWSRDRLSWGQNFGNRDLLRKLSYTIFDDGRGGLWKTRASFMYYVFSDGSGITLKTPIRFWVITVPYIINGFVNEVENSFSFIFCLRHASTKWNAQNSKLCILGKKWSKTHSNQLALKLHFLIGTRYPTPDTKLLCFMYVPRLLFYFRAYRLR